MRVGFIGLGNMGGPMAGHILAAGHTLTVYDARREAANPHIERGARWAESPRAVAAASEIVFTSLPGPKEVEAVALGEGGVLQGAEPGTVYLDLSTSSPTLIRHIQAVYQEKKVHALFGRGEVGHHARHDVRKLAFVHTFSTGQVVYKRIHTAARGRGFENGKGRGGRERGRLEKP